MPEGQAIEAAAPAKNPAQADALKKWLEELGDEGKPNTDWLRQLNERDPLRRLGRSSGAFDGFGLYDSQDQSDEYFAVRDRIGDKQYERSAAEARLTPEKRDELRTARRGYASARSEQEKSRFRADIDKLVPGSAQLTKDIAALVNRLSNTQTMKEIPDPKKCMRCHPRQGPTHFDPNAADREYIRSTAVESFYLPRPEDKFEAVWAKVALESPIVKVNETLKHLPPVKVESPDPVKLVSMGLTMAGVETTATSRELIKLAVGGITKIEKEAGDRFIIDRRGTVEVPFPQKTEIAAGIKLSALELGPISFKLKEGKYPEITDIQGLKVKLEVPEVLGALGVDSHVTIKRVIFARVPNTSDFQISAEVTNPAPFAARKFIPGVPPDETIVVPIVTLGADGCPK